MKRFVFGFIVGGVVCGVIFVLVLQSFRDSDFDSGRRHGETSAKQELADVIARRFGQYDGRSAYEVLWSVKTTDVVGLETNGIKTVRVIP